VSQDGNQLAERNKPHLFVDAPPVTEPYRPPPRAIQGGEQYAPPNRREHATRLSERIQSLGDILTERRRALLRREELAEGIFVTFRSFPGVELALTSLDPQYRGAQPELRAVQSRFVDGEPIQFATVFIPDGKLGYFLKRIDQYLESADAERVRNRNLFDAVEEIGLASIEQLWTDPLERLPSPGELVWWEVWLRRDAGEEITRLRAFARRQDARVAEHYLTYLDRTVALVQTTREQLALALDILDDLAELRAPSELPHRLADEPARDQQDWVRDLVERLHVPDAEAPAICLLDSGVDRGHPLIERSLSQEDSHAVDPAWGSSDGRGHGTEMAGLALYGDLGEHLLSRDPVHLTHWLESVKILPNAGANDPLVWGAITAAAASLVEIEAPDRPRLFSMAVTTDPADTDPASASRGEPTSWSA